MKPAGLLAVACALPLCALAAETGDALLTQQLQHCAAIAAKDARLACFDELARGIASPQQETQRSREEFGMPSTQRAAEAIVSRIEARVIGFGQSSDARPTIKLDNGQVWELDGEDAMLKLQQTVIIRRAALSSFLLTTERKRVHRVRRIK